MAGYSVEKIIKPIGAGMLMSEHRLTTPALYYGHPGILVVEATSVGDNTYLLPDLAPIAAAFSLDGGTDETGGTSMKSEIIPVGLVPGIPPTGQNTHMIATRDPGMLPPLEPIGDVAKHRINVHTIMFAVYQRNPDGTIKIDPDTKQPMYAKDATGQNMVGPLLVTWQPQVIDVFENTAEQVKTAAPDLTPPVLIFQDKPLKVGGFVASGGGEGTGNDWGVLTD